MMFRKTTKHSPAAMCTTQSPGPQSDSCHLTEVDVPESCQAGCRHKPAEWLLPDIFPALPDTVCRNWCHAAVGMLLAFLMCNTYNATLLTGSTLQVSNLLHLLDSVHSPRGQVECPDAAKPLAACICARHAPRRHHAPHSSFSLRRNGCWLFRLYWVSPSQAIKRPPQTNRKTQRLIDGTGHHKEQWRFGNTATLQTQNGGIRYFLRARQNGHITEVVHPPSISRVFSGADRYEVHAADS